MDADDVILVALVQRPRDLDVIRQERWYRIPVKHAPAHFTQASYIAFYLPASFREHKWSIRDYAPVHGHELVRRLDLFPAETDHPRAQELYYKLQLGPVIPLQRPIISRAGRRVLFLWTTGNKFSRAVEIDELFRRSEPEDDSTWWPRTGGERHSLAREARLRYRMDFWIPVFLRERSQVHHYGVTS